MSKRFTYVKNNSISQYSVLPIQEIGKSKALHCQGVVDKLNKLTDENEQLKQQVQNMHKLIDKKIAEVKREYNKYSINSDQAEASIDTLIDLKKELNVE